MRNSEKDPEQKDERGPGEMSSFNNREDNRTGSVEEVEEKENAVGKKEEEATSLQEGAREIEDETEA